MRILKSQFALYLLLISGLLFLYITLVLTDLPDILVNLVSLIRQPDFAPNYVGAILFSLCITAVYSIKYLTRKPIPAVFPLNFFQAGAGLTSMDDALPADSSSPQLGGQDIWLVSPFYDLTFITLSAILIIFPYLAYQLLGENIYVDLTVTMLIGGPHLFATYTMTFMEPRFRRKYPWYTWGALLLPPLIIIMAILNLTLLVTIFFLWASIHVIHQIAYITDAYRMKDPRGWKVTSRVIDYGLILTSLYPIATQKFIYSQFETGGRVLLFPEFLKQGWLVFPVWFLFLAFATAFVVKTIREARNGLFHGPKTLLIGMSAILFFLTPMMQNLDVAFQGLNTWHSFQYLAIVLYLNRLRADKGFIESKVVQKVSRKGYNLYALCLGFTLLAGVAYIAVLALVHYLGVFNTGGPFNMIFLGEVSMDQHFFAFYSVVLSCLLIHYYFDHFLFLQRDKIITPKWD